MANPLGMAMAMERYGKTDSLSGFRVNVNQTRTSKENQTAESNGRHKSKMEMTLELSPGTEQKLSKE